MQFHYSPFASDLVNLSEIDMRFERGTPFTPLTQLMAVLPPKRYVLRTSNMQRAHASAPACSKHALPPCYQRLMTEADSPLIDQYPIDFEIDMEGVSVSWLGVVKLPFIAEVRTLCSGPLRCDNAALAQDRLLEQLDALRGELSDEEILRNAPALDM